MLLSFETMIFQRNSSNCFENMMLSFENMTLDEKVNFFYENLILLLENMTFNEKVTYLLRKYDSFTQEYDKVTPK